MVPAPTHPLRVEAALDPRLSRWLWLVKWILALPHYIILCFLWIAFLLVSIVAFVSILITARYPRPLFDFNVGVIRWSARVSYYGRAVLGTDSYPPFTLGDVPDYPFHLDLEYPERLSRPLVLVKWWLLAIPQYAVVALFVGTGWGRHHHYFGLIGLLSLIAVVILAVTGSYPRALYDLLMGLVRWTLRVLVYAALMTDHYPPFRLDMGGRESAAEQRPPGGEGGGGISPPAGHGGG